MNQPTVRRLAWRTWRSDVAQRLDRRTLGAALAYAAFGAMFCSLGIVFPFPFPRLDPSATFAAGSLLWLVLTMATVLVLAVATTAIARGVSGWLAYPLAVLAIELIGFAAAFALHPYAWFDPKPKLPGSAYALSVVMVGLCLPAGVFYVYASNAKHHARLLQAAEAERATEAERLAQERLKGELAAIDYDLVLTALRRARGTRASHPDQAGALLATVAEYLRAAQQRGATDPRRIANAIAELRQACAAAPDTAEEGSKT